MEFLEDEASKLFNAGDYRGAIDGYTQALALDPSNPTLFSKRATAYFHLALDDTEAAIIHNNNRLIDFDSLYAEYYKKGCIFEAMERYEEALRAFEFALLGDPQSTKVNGKISWIRELQKEKQLKFNEMMASLAECFESEVKEKQKNE